MLNFISETISILILLIDINCLMLFAIEGLDPIILRLIMTMYTNEEVQV